MYRTRKEIEESQHLGEAVRAQLLKAWDRATESPQESISEPEPYVEPSKQDKKLERQIQAETENLLHHLGFWRRTPSDIREGDRPPLGWQMHLHKAKRNPIMLDLLVCTHGGRCCELELKRPGGTWSSREQQILCEDHGYPVFTDSVAAVEYVKQQLIYPNHMTGNDKQTNNTIGGRSSEQGN